MSGTTLLVTIQRQAQFTAQKHQLLLLQGGHVIRIAKVLCFMHVRLINGTPLWRVVAYRTFCPSSQLGVVKRAGWAFPVKLTGWRL